ncbi:MAG: CopG family transcriptional regulator [Deltaproteobacteria bacterium]|nr:CopG family transcriptional regulator [Deltaproteobacteria bacterium]
MGTIKEPVSQKKVTVYLNALLHRALKFKAVEVDKSVSDLISEAVRQSLAEDAADLAAFAERERESNLSFDAVLKELKASGKI